MNTLFDDGTIDMRREVTVRLDDETGYMHVLYEWDGHQSYSGPRIADGHWKLAGGHGSGKASLHCLPEDEMDVLHGRFVDTGSAGIWNIEWD